MKKVLVISFSQSGQLDQIIDNFLIPFNNVEIDRVEIEPKTPFPFPWKDEAFYGIFPDTVLEKPIELVPPKFKYDSYDFIVLGYQPWFLSPSLPTTAIFHNEKFCSLVKNKPIMTIIGSRNMWLNAQESVKKFIKKAEGNLVANIPLDDKTFNLISAITIVYWMTTGKKDRKWGIFPRPGVSDKDITEMNLFGDVVIDAVQNNNYENLQENILKLNKIQIRTNLLHIESSAKSKFYLWANTIIKKGTTPKRRIKWQRFFKYYVNFALFVVSPIKLIIFNLLIRPLTISDIKRKKEYFRSVKLK